MIVSSPLREGAELVALATEALRLARRKLPPQTGNELLEEIRACEVCLLELEMALHARAQHDETHPSPPTDRGQP